MNISIASLSRKIKHPLLKIYSGLTAMALIILITITISLLAAIAVPEARPAIHVTPDEIIMRRESDPFRSILVNLPNGQTLVWGVGQDA